MEIIFKTKKDRSDFVIALLVLLIAFGFIAYQSGIFNSEIPAPDLVEKIQSKEPLKLKVNGTERTYTAVKEEAISPASKRQFIEDDQKNEILAQVDSLHSQEKEKTVRNVQVDSTIEIDSIIIDTHKKQEDNYLLGSRRSDNSKKAIIEKPLPSENLNKDSEDKGISNKTEVKKSNSSANLEVNSNKECIILIGAFAESENKNRLLKTLKNEQFNLFEKEFRGLTRIGVFLPCDQNILQQQLKMIRKRFASDAIIYKQ